MPRVLLLNRMLVLGRGPITAALPSWLLLYWFRSRLLFVFFSRLGRGLIINIVRGTPTLQASRDIHDQAASQLLLASHPLSAADRRSIGWTPCAA